MNTPSQWETTLNCNVVSLWLGAHTRLSLILEHTTKKNRTVCISFAKNYTDIENRELSWWQLDRHFCHGRLSLSQPRSSLLSREVVIITTSIVTFVTGGCHYHNLDRHFCHGRLSLSQPPMLSMTTKLASWQFLVYNTYIPARTLLTSRWRLHAILDTPWHLTEAFAFHLFMTFAKIFNIPPFCKMIMSSGAFCFVLVYEMGVSKLWKRPLIVNFKNLWSSRIQKINMNTVGIWQSIYSHLIFRQKRCTSCMGRRMFHRYVT